MSIREIEENMLEEISGGLEKCKPGEVATTHQHPDGTWSVGCDAPP